jgi:hypothetical protein
MTEEVPRAQKGEPINYIVLFSSDVQLGPCRVPLTDTMRLMCSADWEWPFVRFLTTCYTHEARTLPVFAVQEVLASSPFNFLRDVVEKRRDHYRHHPRRSPFSTASRYSCFKRSCSSSLSLSRAD